MSDSTERPPATAATDPRHHVVTLERPYLSDIIRGYLSFLLLPNDHCYQAGDRLTVVQTFRDRCELMATLKVMYVQGNDPRTAPMLAEACVAVGIQLDHWIPC